MSSLENTKANTYAFDPSEVVGDDMNVLEYQIPFSAESRLKLGGVALNSEVKIAEEA